MALRATGAAGNDTFAGIENVVTGAGNDSLLGDGAANILIAGAGNDTISGGAGNDSLAGSDGHHRLDGGANQDTLFGGDGIDSFCFTTALSANNGDLVLGYSVADDTIMLDDAVFTSIGGLGTLAESAFVIGTTALTLSHRIIFNSTTGELLYDADGIGAVAAIQFATLTSVIGSVTHAEFQII
ncbi:MAG: calcium-binding protein [Roseomonas sp.]